MSILKWICEFDIPSWMFDLFGCKKFRPKLIHTKVCQASLLLPRKCCKNVIPAIFPEEELPTKLCDIHKSRVIKICLDTKKRANKWCPRTKLKKFCPDEIPPVCRVHKAPRVRVKICQDSKLLASPYCPINKVVWKTFLKGKEPLGYCDIHKKPSPAKLTIKDDKLYFLDGGQQKFIGVGVWRREALLLEIGQNGYTWDWCGDNYSLSWAENEFLKYELNYLRTDICNDPRLVREFCERMYKNRVVVELTLRDGDRKLGDIDAVIEATKDLPNIIYEVFNEMYSKEDVHEAVNLARRLRRQGLIVSGGAIGAGGEKWAEYARERGLYDIVSIIQVHRHWPIPGHEDNDWILKYKHFGKPIGRNEFFDRKKLGLSKTQFIFEKSIEHGAQLVNYYGFRMPGFGSKCGEDAEGNPYWKYLEIASKIRKALIEN